MLMKKIYFLLFAAALLVSACGKGHGEAQKVEEPVDTLSMLVTRVQACSRLYTSEYHVHKIITHSDKMRLKGKFFQKDFNIELPVGERKVAIPIDATLKAYVDLSDFSEKNVRKEGKKLTITLPDPKLLLTATKVNHEETKKYVAFTRQNFSDEELTRYEKQGREQIVKAVPQMNILPNAQENAARQLLPIFASLGYKPEDITITFRKEFSLKDIPALIENYTKERR